MVHSFISMGMSFIQEQKEISKRLKDKALKDYEQSLLMPRKKKKKAKQSAIMLYNIACYAEDIFKF